MKSPLSYQSTEYDCGPTTFVNAIKFLFDREEIPPELVKTIISYCLDKYDMDGEAGKGGTSNTAMAFISSWLNKYGEMKKFPIHTQTLKPEEIYIGESSMIINCLKQGGAAICKVYFDCDHYVLITGVDDEYIYLFDPYYKEGPYENAEVIDNAPCKMNRKVRKDIFNSEQSIGYALGRVTSRECILIYNSGTSGSIMDTII